MACLQQATTGIADCNRLTVSMWVRVPSTTIPVPGTNCALSLLTFGLGTWGVSYIRVAGCIQPTTNVPPVGIQVIFCSPVYDIGGGNFRVKFIQAVTTNDFGTGKIFTFDKWHHLLIATDVSQNNFWCGDNYAPDAPAANWYPFYIFMDGISSITMTGYNGTLRGFHPAGEEYIYVSDVGHTGNGFLVSGCPIAMPRYEPPGGALDNFSSAIEFADVQVWFGKYINPTVPSNFSKFVIISGNKGYPVDPSVAGNTFGQQTILFKGKGSDASFWVNRGNGGTFTKTGTITDFTPAPSYG